MMRHAFIRTIRNLLISNYSEIDYLLTRRLIMLNTFLLIGIFTFFLFFMLNLIIYGKTLSALIDLGASVLFFIAFIDLRYRQNEYQTTIFSTVVLALFMLFFMAVNQNRDFSLIWTIFLPIFAIFLLGYRKSIPYVAPYYLLLFSLGFWGLSHWDNPQWNALALARFIIASLVLVFVIYMLEYTLDKLQNELSHLSLTDPLTQLYNRRHIHTVLSKEIKKMHRNNTPLSLAILDLDNFKNINDTYGHNAGDKVLRRFAAMLKQYLREIDTIGRWGGEEFIIVMPQTEFHDAQKILHRLQTKLRQEHFEPVDTLTCSCGLCSAHSNNVTQHDLIHHADLALYKAKREGKDRTEAVALKIEHSGS